MGIIETSSTADGNSAEVVSTLPRVLIVGDGGSGKTTLLRQMLARAAAAGRTPVWVSLSALPSDGPLTIPALVDYLVREAGSRLGVGNVNRQFFESLSSSGQLTIAFDALDECATLAQRQRVRGLVVDVAREWKSCQIFVTSRPEAISDTPLPVIRDFQTFDPERFLSITPLAFTRDDITPFLRVAFDDGEAIAKELLGRTGIEALIATPLTLTLVGLVARTAHGLPATRTPLFARCLDTVCETWEAAKGAQPPPDGLDASQRLDVLRRLGWAAQESGGDLLDADQARVAIAGVPDRDIAARAERVLAGLARRNLLLRAQMADDGSFELQSIRFSHPQFREYLAGAHLAGWFAVDPPAAAAGTAPHCLDTRWLDVLRFAVAIVEGRPARRDAILRAVLNALDPYGDLLHRPEFVVAQLLARLSGAEAAIVAQVTATLEEAAAAPALRDAAASSILGLGHHAPARAAIARFADGLGAGLAFPLDGSQGSSEQMESLRWRLRAIEAHGAASGNALALESLGRLPSMGLEGDLECAVTRMRLGDVAGAEAAFRRLYDQSPDYQADGIALKMGAAGLGALFNQWLAVSMAGPHATLVRARLARQRGVLSDEAPFWTALFERAARSLTQLPLGESQAPQDVAQAMYAVFDLEPSVRSSGSGRALIEAGLRHPSLLWYVASRVVTTMPDLAPEAVRLLTDFILDSGRTPVTRDRESRLSAAVAAICEVPDSGLAVPALLELLRGLEPWSYQMKRIVDELRARGRTLEAFDVLLPLLESPPETADAASPELRSKAWRFIEARWQLADRLDFKRVHAVLDARFRAGDPEDDARRLMGEWNASGIAPIARAWLEAIGEDKSDVRAQTFLHTLTTHERDTAFTDFARQALGQHVFDTDPDPDPPPPTLASCERAFDEGLRTGVYEDEQDRLREVNPYYLAGLLSSIASIAGVPAALERAERWIQQTMAGGLEAVAASGSNSAGAKPPWAGLELNMRGAATGATGAEPGVAESDHDAAHAEPDANGADVEPADADDVRATAVERGRELARVLDALTSRGLRDARWCDLAADVARTLAPNERVELVTWLRTNA